MMDSIRRTILATGAAATAMAAAPRLFAQQTGQGGTAVGSYEKGEVRIHFEEAGSGFPLLLIAGGGLNSTISAFTSSSPFNPIEEFKPEYRCTPMTTSVSWTIWASTSSWCWASALADP